MRCFVLLVWSNILKFTFLNLTSLLCSSIFLFLLWMNQFPCIYLNNKTVPYFPLLPFPSLFLSFPFFTFLFSIQCYSFPLPCCALIYYLPLFFLISSFSNLRPSTPLFSSHPLLLFLLYLLLFSFSSSFTVSVTSSSSSSSSFFLVQARVWRRRKALNCIFEFLSACSKCTAQGVRTYVHVYVRKNWLNSIFIFPSSIFITRYSFLFLVFSRVLIFLIIFHFILFYFYVENSDFCLFSNVILTFFSFHIISFLFFPFFSKFSAMYVRRYVSCVKLVQRTVRTFLVCKSAREIAMKKLWDLIEYQFIRVSTYVHILASFIYIINFLSFELLLFLLICSFIKFRISSTIYFKICLLNIYNIFHDS